MALVWIALVMFFIQYGKPAYFDVTVHNPLQDSILSQSAVSAGIAASWGEVEKDAHHEEAVASAGGNLTPLAVETLGLWSPASLNILREIAVREWCFYCFGLSSFYRTVVHLFMEE